MLKHRIAISAFAMLVYFNTLDMIFTRTEGDIGPVSGFLIVLTGFIVGFFTGSIKPVDD